MFKKSPSSAPLDLFTSFSQNLNQTRLNQLEEANKWWNVFFEHLVSKVPEEDFAVLFSKGQGRPNAPVRILIGMMALKEGFGWSDREMFDNISFNLCVMKALGTNNFNDGVVAPATYYNFKKALYEYAVENGIDLLGTAFEKITSSHAKAFDVLGDHIRLDSTNVGSNIAKASRLELILTVLQQFYKYNKPSHSCSAHQQLSQKKPGQISYGLNKEQRDEMLNGLGAILLNIYRSHTPIHRNYNLIERVLLEQYQIEKDENGVECARLKALKELKSTSLQSPHDEDAAYRKKGGNTTRGYVANITETCGKDQLNLITNVVVEPANVSDNTFVKEGIEATCRTIGEVKVMNTDGAFHSQDNQDVTTEKKIDWVLSGLQGKESNYSFEQVEGQLFVTNLTSGQTQQAHTTKKGAYSIKEEGKMRYFTQTAIQSYNLRKQIKNRGPEEKNMRNNVEATMFQLVLHTYKRKTRYRGKIKNGMWALARCMWINIRRITLWVNKPSNNAQNPDFCFFLAWVRLLMMAQGIKNSISLQINAKTMGF